MLEISARKIAKIIMLVREYGPDGHMLQDYIAGLNVDEKSSLVAVMWIGRGSFEADEFEKAREEALLEATAPTERYLSGMPELAEHLEGGLEALGVDVAAAEEDL